MNSERWQQVKELFAVALETDPAQRSAFLDRACASDRSLRDELDGLLAAEEEAGTEFLKKPASVPEAENELPVANSRIGRRLGPYQIVEEIGVGGMGEVYRAFRADDQYRKQVAIKLVRIGQDSTFVVSRFKNERQVLANLDHPNIARLLDGGTTEEGVPYFVMELIDGEPIHAYCDSHKLSTTARLQLFLQVCEAVQYAHQRLIVHRDLKPSNILVTSEAVPKLLDFGIAKMLDPAAAADAPEPTMSMYRLLTPGYASPEQVKGEEITTVSDVYSLGVLLYELLTGHRPYVTTGRSPHQIARAVCEVDPEKPSTVVRRSEARDPATGGAEITPASVSEVRDGSPEKLSKRLRGDLDNIVHMALRKDPKRRYETVERFATDIRRHLAHLPISAAKDTLGYRASKFVSRHKAAVTGAAMVLITLVAGLVITVHEARIAQLEKARAERRFSDVRQLAHSLLFEIHDAIKDLPGSTEARALLVKRALEYLDSLSQESHGDASLQRELGAAYERVGDVQGQALQANLGDKAGAMASYKKALSIRASLAAANPRDTDIRRELVPNYGKLSDLCWNLGDSAAAIAYSQKAMATAQTLYDGDSKNTMYRRLLAAALLDYGYKQAMLEGKLDAGLKNVERGTTLLEQMVAKDPKNIRLRRNLGLSYSRAGEITAADPTQAELTLAYLRKALATQTANSEADHNNAELRRLAAYDQYSVGEQLATMERYAESLQDERAAFVVFQDLSQKDPANMELREDIGYVEGDIGKVLVRSGQENAAIPQLRSALATLTKMAEARQPKSRVGSAISKDQYWLGKAYTAAAFAVKRSHPDANDCQQAQAWFLKSVRGASVRGSQTAAQSTPGNAAADPMAEDIQHEMARCGITSEAAQLGPQ
jgi:eukaryotic-like serine/threonine-protein kinase